MTRRAFDHIAIAARSLAEGAAWLEGRLGITPEPGGRHPMMGTHNMLLSLGPGAYLELIAIDPEAQAPGRPRWFGLDGFDDTPRLAGWVIRETPLQRPAGTRIAEASRGDLRWRITQPDSGQMPQAGAEPMRIDWGAGPHPSDRLPDRGLQLSRLDLPLDLLPLDDPRIRLGPGFSALITTARGEVRL